MVLENTMISPNDHKLNTKLFSYRNTNLISYNFFKGTQGSNSVDKVET